MQQPCIPVLRAIVELADEGTGQITPGQIAARAELDEPVVHRELGSLAHLFGQLTARPPRGIGA